MSMTPPLRDPDIGPWISNTVSVVGSHDSKNFGLVFIWGFCSLLLKHGSAKCLGPQMMPHVKSLRTSPKGCALQLRSCLPKSRDFAAWSIWSLSGGSLPAEGPGLEYCCHYKVLLVMATASSLASHSHSFLTIHPPSYNWRQPFQGCQVASFINASNGVPLRLE